MMNTTVKTVMEFAKTNWMLMAPIFLFLFALFLVPRSVLLITVILSASVYAGAALFEKLYAKGEEAEKDEAQE